VADLDAVLAATVGAETGRARRLLAGRRASRSHPGARVAGPRARWCSSPGDLWRPGGGDAGPIEAWIENVERAEAAADVDGSNLLEAHAWLDGPLAPRVASQAPREAVPRHEQIALRAERRGTEIEPAPAWGRWADCGAVPRRVGRSGLPTSPRALRERSMQRLRCDAAADADAAHLPNLEYPDAFNAALLAFTARAVRRRRRAGVRRKLLQGTGRPAGPVEMHVHDPVAAQRAVAAPALGAVRAVLEAIERAGASVFIAHRTQRRERDGVVEEQPPPPGMPGGSRTFAASRALRLSHRNPGERGQQQHTNVSIIATRPG
jgi:hypothetical protein